MGEVQFVKILKVDGNKGIQIPGVRKVKEPFPRGSLLKYSTLSKANKEMALFKGCSLELPE